MRKIGRARAQRLSFPAAVLAAASLTAAPGLQAQAIRGQVVDAEDSSAVSQASVRVLLDGEAVRSVVTDGQGGFEVRVPAADRYTLSASALGYAAVDAVVEVGARELVEVTLRLAATPIELEGITVEARRRDPIHAATYEGLYARHEAFPALGSRRVVLRDDHEMANASRVEDVLRWFPSARGCTDYYINGQPRDGFLWDVMNMPPAWLEGIEFYRDGRAAPIDYFGGRCESDPMSLTYSVVAIWYERADGRE